MNKEFIPYEQALELKELGFNEPCLTYYDGKGTEQIYFNSLLDGSGKYRPFENHERLSWFGAPLYQQAFRWFMEKHGLHISLFVDDDKTFGYSISYFIEEGRVDKPLRRQFKTHEEAEHDCLKKLIEIVKNNSL